MKTCILAALLVLVSVPYPSRSQNPVATAAVVETVTAAVYKATWDGPFFTVVPGKLLGYLPGQFSFRETTWRDGNGMEEFSIELNDVGTKLWVRLHSDTLSRKSAVWLPRKPKEVLGSAVIRFIRALQAMFVDSSDHMEGVFVFGKKTLFAEAVEDTLSPDEASKFRPARAFTVCTFDSTRTPALSGRVVVAVENNILRYRKVAVYLPDDDLRVTLEERKK